MFETQRIAPGGGLHFTAPSMLTTSITTVINAVDKGANQATNAVGLYLWESSFYPSHKVAQQLDKDVTQIYPLEMPGGIQQATHRFTRYKSTLVQICANVV